jgi:phage/plasmid-associated DNA primase
MNKLKKYLLQALSTCLSCETKEKKLYILTGSGSNGKSLTMEYNHVFILFDFTLL